MALNESKRKTRERWPAQFDIEGVPPDHATRQKLLEEIRNSPAEETAAMAQFKTSSDAVHNPVNSFSTDKNEPPFISDINNPPTRPYKHQAYPKVMYGHEGALAGRVLQVNDAKEEAAAKKRGFKEQPSENHDYSRIRGGRAAEQSAAPPDRELTAAQLAELDAGDPEE